MRLVGQGFILQQDNDPKHKSKLCQNYLRKKEQDETRTSDIDADTETPTSPQRNTKPLRDGPLTAAQRRINIRRKSNTPQLRLCDQEGHRPITNQTNWQEMPPSNHAIKTTMVERSISNHTTPTFQPPNHTA
ncbi:hypothetical protein MHYP_G00150310 [Metynnis hypsauchen]